MTNKVQAHSSIHAFVSSMRGGQLKQAIREALLENGNDGVVVEKNNKAVENQVLAAKPRKSGFGV